MHGDQFQLTTPTYAHPRSCYMPQFAASWNLEAPLWTMFYAVRLPTSFSQESLRNVADEEYTLV